MSNARLTEPELLAFLQALDTSKLVESQHHEFKSGLAFGSDGAGRSVDDKAKRADVAAMIREQVAAFANSNGGVLIVGVSDKSPYSLEPAPTMIGNSAIDEWAVRSLKEIGPAIAPLIRVCRIDVAGGCVLVIAALRSARLVHTISNGELTTWLRIGDATIRAPAFLVEDLLVGRRAHPELVLEAEAMVNGTEPVNKYGVPINVHVVLVNEGFVAADEITYGGVFAHPNNESRAPTAILSAVDADVPTGWRVHHHAFSSARREPLRAVPFSRQGIPAFQPLIVSSQGDPREVCAAIYLVSHGSPPIWYQLRAVPTPSGTARVTVERVEGTRPKVGWFEL